MHIWTLQLILYLVYFPGETNKSIHITACPHNTFQCKCINLWLGNSSLLMAPGISGRILTTHKIRNQSNILIKENIVAGFKPKVFLLAGPIVLDFK